MNFSSKYFMQENNAPYAVHKAYQMYNAGIRLRSEDSRWQVALIGRNLSDKQYVSSSYDLPLSFTPGTIDAKITRPRQVTV